MPIESDRDVDDRPTVDPLAALREPAVEPSILAGIEPRLRALIARYGPRRTAVLGLLALGIAVAGLLVWRAAGVPPAREPVPPVSPWSGSAAPQTLPPGAGEADVDGGADALTVVVHAAGAVTRPGLYRLAPTARVGDLIDAAGGLAADADPDRVNLAAALVDGTRIYVPRMGEVAPAVAAGQEGEGTTATPVPGEGGALVDLNRADAAALDALPGVGPATAAAIIDHRTRNGPFSSVQSLLDVRGIGPAKLEQLEPLVRV